MAVDYYICAVHYQTVGSERQITKLKTTLYLSTEIGASSEKAKAAVISDILNGRKVRTKLKPGKKWREGGEVQVVLDDTGTKFIRADGSEGPKDALGPLPEY